MSETEQAQPAGPSAGAMLRAAREQAGVHIASLAVALKVPVARLEALEAERFDLLPDPPFVRALAGGVCRALKLDPGPVLALLPQRNPTGLVATAERSDRATFRTTPPAPASLAGIGGGGARHPVFWIVAVILLAAATLLLVPAARLDAWMQAMLGTHGAEQIPAPVGGDGDQQTLPGEPPVAAVAPMGPESTRGEASPAAGPAGAATAPAANSEPSLQPSNAMTMSMAAPPATLASSAEGVVTFSATDSSWIRVTDSRGATVMEKVLQPGSQLSASGSPPLSVVVGNAGATSVQVRGKAFDLSAITRNNVARFEVR